MPAYVATRITRALNDRSRAVRGSRVLLLGVTYKADVADARETPAVPVARRLLEMGAQVRWHDPFVDEFAPAGQQLERVEDPVAGAAASDVVVLLQAHTCYDLEGVAAAADLLFDTRGATSGPGVERL
jgi:UDP-N-acetyl-D-mannosaminuronate dehydrogenase